MKITVDPFDSKSIDKALKSLREYEKSLRAKENELVRRLMEIGVSVAETGFATADYDGTNDVLISWTQNGSRAAVIAYGETVGFIEFGTGVRYPEYDSSEISYTPPPRGSYGKGHGKNPKGWYYVPNEGVSATHTYGNPPAEVFITVRDVMIERITSIAREVFG